MRDPLEVTRSIVKSLVKDEGAFNAAKKISRKILDNNKNCVLINNRVDIVIMALYLIITALIDATLIDSADKKKFIN